MRLTLNIVGKTLFSANVADEANEVRQAMTHLVELFDYLLLEFRSSFDRRVMRLALVERALRGLDDVRGRAEIRLAWAERDYALGLLGDLQKFPDHRARKLPLSF